MYIGLIALQQFTPLSRQLLQEIIIYCRFNPVNFGYHCSSHSIQNGLNVILGVLYLFGSDHPLQYNVDLVVVPALHNTGAVDKIDPLGETDILPVLGFPGNGGRFASLFALENVDDRRFADVGVADEANLEVSLGLVELVELSEQVDEVESPKGGVYVCLESNGGF